MAEYYLGQNIRFLRRLYGLSVTVFAKQIGSPVNKVTPIEEGTVRKIDTTRLNNICQVLGVSLDTLVTQDIRFLTIETMEKELGKYISPQVLSKYKKHPQIEDTNLKY